MTQNTTTNKQRLKEITDGIEQSIKDLFQSDRYAEYLRTMSRFHKYSVNNQILIFTQCPDATLVAGFGKWRDQFERHVKKGEKGIKIIAPTPYKKKIETDKLDPDTRMPVLNPDGSVMTEEKEIRIPMYRQVVVFDQSQTTGKPLPTLVANLTGNVERYDFFSEALLRASPVPITFEDTGNRDGYFNVTDQHIVINENMSEVQTVCAILHEICHSKIHNYEQQRLAAAAEDENAEPPVPKDRNTEEVESESVATAVAAYYNIDTSENSLGYIASWSSNKELPELRASLETINKTASSFISDIDYHYRAVVKEYDIVIEQFAADCDTYLRDASDGIFPLAKRDEAIKQAFEDIKAGNSGSVRANILMYSQNEGVSPPDELLRRLDAIEKNYPPRETQALYLLDDEIYLHIQETGDGFDYSLYDKESLREIDGGLINDAGDISLDDAYVAALEIQRMYPESSEKVSLDILDDIAAARQQDMERYIRENNLKPVQTEAGILEPDSITNSADTEKTTAPPDTHDSSELPDAPEQSIDYPMPDPDLTVSDLESCGYMDGDMLPISRDRALELYEQDFTIYAIIDGGGAEMLFDREDFDNESHNGLFAISGDEWEDSREFESASRNPDTFEIYQVKQGDEYRDFLFEPYDRLQVAGHEVDRDNYDLVYAALLTVSGTTNQKLESIYQRFNLDHPDDFTGRSLSMSDIVALKQSGDISYHYCDRIGFMELPGFNSGKNSLRSVEDTFEQNDNQLDGVINNVQTPSVAELEAQAKSGQPISLMDLTRAAKEENRDQQSKPEKRPSVLEKLRQPNPQSEHKKIAHDKSADLER